MSPQALSEVVASIYDCALDPGRWEATLAGLRQTLDYATASISLIALPAGDTLLDISASERPDWVETIRRNRHEAIDIWGGAEAMMRAPLGEPLVLSRLRDRGLWERNRLYREWGRAEGIHDFVAIALVREEALIGSLSFVRHVAAGDVGEPEVEAARLLVPHVQRAVAISRLLDLRSIVSSTFEAMLDALAVAVALVDDDLRIVHANAVARDLLASGGPIGSRRGFLRIRPAAVGAALAVAVREAAENEASAGRRGFGVPPGVGGVAHVLHVLPLRHGALRPGLMPSAVAAVFIAPALAPPPAPAETLAALYDLTPAEARVFVRVAAGLTRAEAAAALGIGPSTVKAHLAQIFAKTGTRRQADLVGLAAAIALPVRP